jgi:arylsulfatase A-like enzyme
MSEHGSAVRNWRKSVNTACTPNRNRLTSRTRMSYCSASEAMNNAPDRRTFLRNSVAAAAALSSPGLLTEALSQTPARKPNIVFFLGEGARWDECSISGNKILHTPNIDWIGREGVIFKNAFVTNALCLPSRASILSGMYSHTTGAVDNGHMKVPDTFPLITDMIRDAGYEIAFIGKSHVEGALRDRYWDYYFGFNGQADYPHPVITEGRNGKYGEPQTYNEYVDDLLTDKAVAWLNEPHEKPFCLLLWFYAPHAPFYRPMRHVNDFNGVPIPKPKSFDEYDQGYPGKPKLVAEALNKIGAQFLENDAPRSLEELVKDHYAGIESNDDDMARIFQVLREKNIADDTAVLWSSDHGFFLGEHRFYDKRLMYEPSIRVPLMIRYPRRIKAGTVREEMAINVDVASTVLDIAGIPIPAAFQGKNLMPLAEGKQIPWRKDWLYEYYEYPGAEQIPQNRGVRTERYKYIHYYAIEPQAFELYDLQIDPDEMHNLYGDPKYADLTAQLKARLEELRKETNDHYIYTPPAPAPKM